MCPILFDAVSSNQSRINPISGTGSASNRWSESTEADSNQLLPSEIGKGIQGRQNILEIVRT
jgi:hypothetical protein